MRAEFSESDGLILDLESQEILILHHLLSELVETLESHREANGELDPLAIELEIGGSATLPSNPALARLLPNAYADEAEASEFRQLTENALLARKLEDALVLQGALASIVPEGEHGKTRLGVPEIAAWVRTLTALRLTIAAQMGINTSDDQDLLRDSGEQEANFAISDWLAALIEIILHFEEMM